ncbi:hypothetical protein HYP87_gp138 [Salmonella phage SE14]|uniref:Uncharacterized protein n=1 Tax=Salmonella phage SE14 TaxID=2592196 RepID=A0A5C0CB06_9CAUD|nr:hypothetical protein HYP87_gp138 [Salmonella phage SE14]QEI23446.1 hypothetical protein [Salmonella phage SE14]
MTDVVLLWKELLLGLPLLRINQQIASYIISHVLANLAT